jgi:hypothetical protein
MRGGAWNVGRLQRGELLPQHRYDVLSEQVDLLENGLQRQACCGLPTVSGVSAVKSSRDGPCPYTGALSK